MNYDTQNQVFPADDPTMPTSGVEETETPTEAVTAQPDPVAEAQPQPAVEAQPATPEPSIAQYEPQPTTKKEKKEPKPKANWSSGAVIALCLCAALLGGLVGAAAIGYLPQGSNSGSSLPGGTQFYEGSRPSTVIETHQVDTSKIMTAAEVYATNVNSTVGITTSVTTNYWGYQTTSPASGSGFILSEDGYILTNYHVVEDSNSITVRLYNGQNHSATVIGYDVSNDIAVLKIDATGLTPVVLGDSDNMNVGDSVVAIGNPLGELTFSLTAGTVSALDREVTLSNGIVMNLMQTDCAINSGNSGGALFNMYGEVIGITNAKYSSSSMSEASIDNIGFAIPCNSVRGIIQGIIEKGYYAKPYIGVSVVDVSEDLQSYGLPAGASVRSVVEDSPAEKGGLMAKDIITAVNGISITGSQSLVNVIDECQPGDVLKLLVYRQGVEIELSITVGEQIQSTLPQSSQSSSGSQNRPGGPQGWDFDDFEDFEDFKDFFEQYGW